jgi:metallo-beta-lactamase class B
MHDGQNLFNTATSFAGEWEVDECLSRLFAGGDYGAIVVGIDNGGSQRINEYSPWVHPQYGGGQGDAYVQFIVQHLKPYVDAHFRSDSTRNGTWIWGSSMGGFVSQYAAVRYQEVFSRAGVFSPSLWFDNRIMQQPSLEGYRWPVRFYVMAGALESSSMVAQVQQLKDALVQAGFPAGLVQTVIRSDGQHAEWFWRREFEQAYRWLQGQAMASVEPPKSVSTHLEIYPNPTRGLSQVVGPSLQETSLPGQFLVRDPLGRIVYSVTDSLPLELDLTSYPRGFYTVELRSSEGRTYRDRLRLVD